MLFSPQNQLSASQDSLLKCNCKCRGGGAVVASKSSSSFAPPPPPPLPYPRHSSFQQPLSPLVRSSVHSNLNAIQSSSSHMDLSSAKATPRFFPTTTTTMTTTKQLPPSTLGRRCAACGNSTWPSRQNALTEASKIMKGASTEASAGGFGLCPAA